MIYCDKCGAIMMEDTKLSIIEYDEVTKELLDEDGNTMYHTLPSFMMFSCRRCGETKKVEILDLVRSIQSKIVNQLLEERLKITFMSADRSKVDEASGISYCGLCPGVIDDSGYCYNDVISQCRVRKVKLKK